MKEFKAIKSVYCYYFPEIRNLIDDLTRKFPHEIFLRSIFPKLDDFHFPVIEKYVKVHSKTFIGLENFKHRYFTNGSSEGIFHLLVFLKTRNPNTIIYVFKGDYEGYKNYAKCINLKVIEIDPKENPSNFEKGVWLISNPSAINGNIIPNSLVDNICGAGHKVALDCAYVGLTKPHLFHMDNPNVIAVFFSFSKPFGLFYYRIGFLFSKDKIESLEGNIWFKNIFSLLIANKILSEIEPVYFYKKYRPLQERIINEINREFNLNMKLSDVVILGNIEDETKLNPETIKLIERFRRGNCYRFCLTPYFLEKERM